MNTAPAMSLDTLSARWLAAARDFHAAHEAGADTMALAELEWAVEDAAEAYRRQKRRIELASARDGVLA